MVTESHLTNEKDQTNEEDKELRSLVKINEEKYTYIPPNTHVPSGKTKL